MATSTAQKYEEKRQKNREKTLSRVAVQKMFHAYNFDACKYFDKLSVEKGWNLRHAENGGEFLVRRYWVDAYDEKLNIVVEYDEPRHYSGGVLKKKDVERMNRIISELNCRFFRYNESTKELIQYA